MGLMKLGRNEKEIQPDKTIDFTTYNFNNQKNEPISNITNISDVNKQDIEDLTNVGISINEEDEQGLFLLYGDENILIPPKIKGIEIKPIYQVLKEQPNIREKYFFNAVKKDLDKFTLAVSETIPRGYFIHVKKNVKIETPIQTAFFMNREMNAMCPHNIVILEEGAQIHLLTGCTASCFLKGGLHIAISEHYVGKNATLINSMIHNWRPQFNVFPKTGSIVEEGGSYKSYYYSLKPPKYIEMDPYTYLIGKKSNAKHMTVIITFPETYSKIGGRIFLKGESSKSEIIMRTINHGGTAIQSGLITGAC